MSGTISAPSPDVLASESGPASGTTPEVAAAIATPADSHATEPSPTSILSEAAAATEAPAPEAPAPEAPAAEVKPETAAVVPPTYEPFTFPEGVTIASERLEPFTGLLGEFEARVTADPAQAHAAAQEFGQKVLGLYIAQAQADAARFSAANAEAFKSLREQWTADFKNDPDIGKNRMQTSLTRMGGLMDMYGQSAGAERLKGLREVMSLTGAGDNPEVLRFVNWAASRLGETSRPVAAPMARAPVVGSKAQRLYKNSQGAA
jgi:hypothetical protein